MLYYIIVGEEYCLLVTSIYRDLIKLTEGLEIPEFWDDLGGKAKHSHFNPPASPAYIRPHLYLCEVTKDSVVFQELPPTSKEEMKSEQCYFFVYKEQVCE